MKISQVIYFTILIVGVIIGMIKFKRLSAPGKALFILILFVLLKELSAFILAKKTGFNLSFYKYLSPVDFILTMTLFWFIPTLRQRRSVLVIIAVGVFLFYILNIFIWQPPGKGIDSNFKLVKSFFLVLVSLMLFIGMAKNVYEVSFYRNSEFWVGSAILIFYVVSIFYWGVFNFYLGNKELILRQLLRPIFDYANYILYGFLAMALWFDIFLYPKKGI